MKAYACFVAAITAARSVLAIQDVADLSFGPSLPGPSDYSGHAQQAYYKAVAGDLRGAADELTQAINVAPSVIKSRPDLISDLFSRRAQVWNLGHQPDAALKDCIAAIKLYRKNSDAYLQSYFAFLQLHQYHRAVESIEAGARVSPKYAYSYLNSAAWLMAASPDPQARNGKAAIADALRACELNQWKDWHVIDTLAAAYAEAGDFAQAVAYEQRAVAAAGNFAKNRKDLESRVALYAAHQPYRDAKLKY